MTTMKKIFLVAVVLLCSVVAHAQQTEAVPSYVQVYGVAMQKSNMLMARGATTDFAEAEEQPSLEFSKIKLSYRVQVKFVLE